MGLPGVELPAPFRLPPVIVDFHTHIFPPWTTAERERHVARDSTLGELYADPKSKMASAEDLVAAMDGDGVDLSVAMGIGWTDIGLAREANDYTIDAVRRYPRRLAGFAGINPGWGSKAADEASRCAEAGLKGIGELHPDTQAYDLADQRVLAPMMGAARQHNLIVMTHSSEPVGHSYAGKGRTGPEVLWEFVRHNPDVTIVCAHWGGGLPFYALMPEVESALANVYFDTAASPLLYGRRVFEVCATLVGASQVLFGSDFPLLSARRLLKQIEDAALSDADKAAITGGNAQKLLAGLRVR